MKIQNEACPRVLAAPPRKAILLAAGLGTRMRPLSNDLPKPVMPLWGTPVIGHLIDMLAAWGVEEFLVNLHHNPQPVLDYLKDRARAGMRIALSFEPAILGTGGMLRRAGWFLDAAPFWIVNTDIAVDLDPRPLLREFRRQRPVAALWLHPRQGPRTVEMRDGAITSFRSAAPGRPGTYTFCGLHLASPDLVDYLADGAGTEAFAGIVGAYENAMARGRRVSGVTVPNAFWADLGTPESYLEAHRAVLGRRRLSGGAGGGWVDPEAVQSPRRLRRAGVLVQGFAAVGRGVRVAGPVTITDSVVWDGVVLERGARLRGAVVGRGARVRGGVGPMAVRVEYADARALVRRILGRLGWPEAGTTVLPLAARGSDRSFTRLSRRGESVIFIHYGHQRKENERYAGHARFLRARGVPVPRVLLDWPSDSAVVMEDCGDTSLQSCLRTLSARRRTALYERVLDALLELHRIPLARLRSGRVRMEPSFSKDLYRWERELLTRHYLQGRLGLKPSAIGGVLADLETVAAKLLSMGRVLVHRDMQSSNILLRGGRDPVFIDFQGMRPGPAAYDLASLLCDPYVMLPPDFQSALLDYYAERTAHPGRLTGCFWFAAVQRLSQAIGAYARLGAHPETQGFLSYIPPALAMMDRALRPLDGLKTLRTFVTQAMLLP